MLLRLAAALLLVAAAGACGSDLPSASFIDKLRVLAVQADPPEVAPGTATTVHALVVEPNVKAADVMPPDALWLACKPPAGALQDTPCAVTGAGVPPLCDVAPSAAVCVVSIGPIFDVSYTPDTSSLGTDGTGQVLLTVVVADNGPATNCLTDIQQHEGTPQHPDRCVIAFKRLVVNGNPGATLNKNPLLTALTLGPRDTPPQPLDGTAQFPVDGSTMILHTTRADDAAEKDAQGNYEALSVSWFTTSGKIDGGRSQFDVAGCAAASDCPMAAPVLESTTSWEVPSAMQLSMTADASQSVHFWVVVRDTHGGVSWLDGAATPKP